MRISFKVQPQHTDWASIATMFRAGEEIPELDAGWLFDHFYPINSDDPHGPCFEGWTALAFLAGATERLRLGVMVSGNTYRHPAVLANMCATLDVASGGRLEIGIGGAWNEEEHRAYGIAFPPVAERLDALEEACEVLHLLLTERSATYSGRFYRLQDAYCEPKPVQAPRPPLVIGGQGERRTLRIAARWADQWNYPGDTADGLRQKLEVLHGHCQAVGRDPAQIEVSMHLFRPTDPVEAARQARERAAAGAGHLILYFEPPFDPATLRHVAAAVADAVL